MFFYRTIYFFETRNYFKKKKKKKKYIHFFLLNGPNGAGLTSHFFEVPNKRKVYIYLWSSDSGSTPGLGEGAGLDARAAWPCRIPRER